MNVMYNFLIFGSTRTKYERVLVLLCLKRSESLTNSRWPLTTNSTLTEWLLSSGQHLWLQQHVRLLSNWCEWNCCTSKIQILNIKINFLTFADILRKFLIGSFVVR